MVRLDPALVKFWLTRRDVSQRRLCEETRLAETDVSRIVRGLVPVTEATAERIAITLGVTVDHLLRGTGERRIGAAVAQ